jgi:phosphoglycerate dehydrogenase-like enzyme
MTDVLVLDREAPILAAAVREALGGVAGGGSFELLQAGSPDELDARMRGARILLAPPDLGAAALSVMPRLAWVQSTWAGVAPLLEPLRSLAPRHRPVLTSAKGIFGPRMAEYVFGAIAMVERSFIAYHERQLAGRWDRLEQRDMAGRTLLLLGTGSIGAHLARVAAAFDLHVIGVSRRGRPVAGVELVFPVDCLHRALADADYVVSSLPDTPASRHLLDAAAFRAMRCDAILVNVGRGNVLDEAALVSTLRGGHLRAAVLDVFQQEPLPPGHPFWTAPRLHLTPHVAAFTPIEGIAGLFARNLDGYRRGETLEGEVDVEAGY